MSSQASSAGHGEADVRRKLVETGDVDVMISIRSNFFYTRTVPCELWHLDKGKPAERRDQVLMLDARNIYRKLTRKIYDFSPEQLRNVTAVVWLYRGQPDRFLVLVQNHLDRTLAEAAVIVSTADIFRGAYTSLTDAAAPFIKTLTNDSPLHALIKDRDDAAEACIDKLNQWTARIARDWNTSCQPNIAAQKARLVEFDALAEACRDLVKDVDLVCKLAARLVDTAEKHANARAHDAWDGRTIGRLEKELDTKRKGLVEQLKDTAYFQRQAHWLLTRFPEAEFVPVAGLCRIVTRKEIEAADWNLTPGRYVGVAPPEVDDDFDFEQTLREIHVELADLNEEAATLATKIHENFEGLGI
jgi:type I restriction enzyme M protein